MNPINPSQSSMTRPGGTVRQAQSVYKVLNGGISESQPTGQDPSGVFNKFQQDNGAGVTLRIGALGSAEPLKWTGNNIGLVINHGLQRQPIGFRIHDQDQGGTVYRTVPPDATQITLATTSDIMNVTVYIF
jgi:hypothetical protein